jgi:hypothetical protein
MARDARPSVHGRYMGMAVHDHLTRVKVCVWVPIINGAGAGRIV